MPHGHDLGPLLVGDLQLGKRDADDLAALDEAITTADVAGLRAEGDQTPLEVVRRGHAVSMLIFSGISALPIELLEAPDSPELRSTLDLPRRDGDVLPGPPGGDGVAAA